MTENTEPAMGEIVLHPTASGMEEYRPRIVMEASEAKALDDQLRASMKAVLRADVDYGKIPGSNKDSLLKPGAEKLLQWFGFGHVLTQTEVERDADGRWAGVTYRCTVSKGMPDGRSVVVATCEGYAGYDEDRFFTSAEQAEAKERANAERYRRSVNPSKFFEYRAPRNSVIKMAQKRAMVGAALQATSASSLFTQDMEDETAATPAALVAAGRAAITALPEAVRTELDAWYSALNWPDPDAWDASQWCTALVKAGKLSAGMDSPRGPQGQAAPTPERRTETSGQPIRPGDPFFTRVPENAEQSLAWVGEFTSRLSQCATKGEGTRLYKVAAEMGRQRAISRDEVHRLQAMVTEQMKDLLTKAGIVIPAGLDPEDPWLAKVEEVVCAEDAAAAAADVRQGMKSGSIAQERGEALLRAIDARVGFPSGAAA